MNNLDKVLLGVENYISARKAMHNSFNELEEKIIKLPIFKKKSLSVSFYNKNDGNKLICHIDIMDTTNNKILLNLSLTDDKAKVFLMKSSVDIDTMEELYQPILDILQKE